MYRGFIKNITNLTGNALGSADLRIQGMNIKRDILSKATSSFTVLGVPSAAQEGNIFGVYDDYGQIVYLGVITSISGKEIQTSQIISIFNDKWLWRDPQEATIEETVETILENDFVGSADTMQASIWGQYSITHDSSSPYFLQTHEDNYVTNFMDFIISLYDSYEILLDINIPYSTGTPSIKITKNTDAPLQLGNNTFALRNFEITRETQETNKLVVLSQDASAIRGTYYATTSGITDDSTSLNRLPKINTVYVFSDDPIGDIVAENLSEQMYNHKITCELVLNNKLYDFNDFTLGRQCNIFYNNEYYNSILTGYEVQVDDEGKAEKAKLIFGKVRYSLDKKLYAESRKDNIATSNYAYKVVGMNDMVVEEGTSGNWRYRKWSSGRAECWCEVSRSVAITTGAGISGLYRNNTAINSMAFPTGLFTDAPAVYCTVKNTSGTIIWTTPPSGSVTATNFPGNHNWHIGSGTYTCVNGYYAVGKWK